MDVLTMVLIIAAIFGVLIYYKKYFVKKYNINPELSVSDLLSLFQDHFGEKYEIYRSKEFGSDFNIKKSGDEGIAFKLKNNKKRAALSFWPFIPDDKSRPTFFWSVIAANRKGKEIKLEMADFIENHPNLKAQ